MWTGKEKALRFQVPPNSPKTLVSIGWLKEAILPSTDQRKDCLFLHTAAAGLGNMPKTQVGQPYGDTQANSQCARSGTRSNLAIVAPSLI